MHILRKSRGFLVLLAKKSGNLSILLPEIRETFPDLLHLKERDSEPYEVFLTWHHRHHMPDYELSLILMPLATPFFELFAAARLALVVWCDQSSQRGRGATSGMYRSKNILD